MCVCVFHFNLKTGANLIPNKHFRHSHPTPEPMTTEYEIYVFSLFQGTCVVSRFAPLQVCVRCASCFHSAAPKNIKKYDKIPMVDAGSKMNERVYVCALCMRLFGRYTSGGMRF